jgi:hypothetical protein
VLGGIQSAGDPNPYFDPTLAVFRGTSISTPIACSDDGKVQDDPDALNADVRLFIPPGLYGLQVGGADDDCCDVEEGDFNLTAEFEPAPSLRADVRRQWTPFGSAGTRRQRHKTRIELLKVIAPGGSLATVRCRRDCEGIRRFAGDQLHVPNKGSLNLRRKFGDNTLLSPGTTIKIFVKSPEGRTIGKFWRFQTRRTQKAPSTRTCNLQPDGALTSCRNE